MDTEAIVERVLASGAEATLIVLATSREELLQTCQEDRQPRLVSLLAAASDEELEHVARKLGERVMGGLDYWESIPLVVEDILG